MSFQVEKLEKSMAKFIIEVPAEEFEQELETVYRKNRSKYAIPGFRKGKVPRSMIERMYGPSVFFEDAVNELVPIAYDKTLEETTEEIVSYPQFDITQVEKGKPLIFTALVALKPDASLGQYKGIEIDPLEAVVTEEDLDQVIAKEREENSRSVIVTDRPVQDGDMITLDYEGFDDGVAFEGGKGENYPLTIGSHSFIPGFEEGLIGAQIGETIDVAVTFPADYSKDTLAGKPVVFVCTVREIRVKELPELDDEFAAEVSEYETMAEYREDIRQRLQKDKEDEVASVKEEAVLRKMMDSAEIELPEAMLETRTQQIIEDMANRMQRSGLTLEQYLQYTQMTMDTLKEQARVRAQENISSRLILEAVAREEGFEATEEEIEAEILKIAEAQKMTVEEVQEALSEKGRKQLIEDVCVSKALKLVVDSAVMKTAEADF
jgi:trigger factor